MTTQKRFTEEPAGISSVRRFLQREVRPCLNSRRKTPQASSEMVLTASADSPVSFPRTLEDITFRVICFEWVVNGFSTIPIAWGKIRH